MDKSWTSKPRHSIEYLHGVDNFLNFAFRDLSHDDKIVCPCTFCGNVLYQSRNIVRAHLVCEGMAENYNVWGFLHGEHLDDTYTSTRNSDQFEDQFNGDELVRDAFGVYDMPSFENEDSGDEKNNEMVDDVDMKFEVEDEKFENRPNQKTSDLFKFLEEGNQELYPGSTSTILSFILELMQLKCDNSWTESSVDRLLEFLKRHYPNSRVPKSCYEAKKTTRKLGLKYEKIHACPNNCMLYRGARSSQQSCHICNASRWKDKRVGGTTKKKKVAAKILRYFPLIPRLQRLYMSLKTSSSMRWHGEGRTDDDTLRHPADSLAWKDFDKRYPEFASDFRNVRIGLAGDGFNASGNMANSYSIWPIVLVLYNLPPWTCMKQSSIILSMIIPGKESPGDKIDIFLQPLIDDLLKLWEGIQTYDASTKENFKMRAALIWTLNDFPAYASLSGWSTKGKYACPCCADKTQSRWLKNGGKYCYCGHRRWLDPSHKFRTQKQLFDGNEEHGEAPITLSGSDALKQLQGVDFIEEGVACVNESKMWKKKSIFFKLPYWEFNTVRHNLDVMHIERNVCENVLGTLLNIKGKSKDNLKARYDLEDIGIRRKLHPVKQPNGKVIYPSACYTMTKKEKDLFLKVLKHMKVPDNYASNISSCINVKDRKLQFLKTHDYHILMQDLLPIALRFSMKKKRVTKLIIELSDIFKAICSKSINVQDMENVKTRAILLLCHMEKCFPPSFFTIMVHLIIHLADEAKVAGPVHFRWMFPMERCWKVYKNYIGNKTHREGSIAEGYIAQECITFCSRYFNGIETVFNRQQRNEDIDATERDEYLLSSGGRIIGAFEMKELDDLSLVQAHRYVLLHVDEVKPFVEEFKKYKVQTHGRKRIRSNSRILQKWVNEEFHTWFKAHVATMDSGAVSDKIRWLSLGPFPIVTSSQGFIFNGIRFHTKERNRGKQTQNFGVVLTSMTPSVASARDPKIVEGEVEYFGELVDIIELNYCGEIKVVLFRCNWADVTHGKGVKKDKYGFTLVNFTKLSHTGKHISDEPFVIPSQVQQVFYVRDPLNPKWKAVIKTVPRDVFDLGQGVASTSTDTLETEVI